MGTVGTAVHFGTHSPWEVGSRHKKGAPAPGAGTLACVGSPCVVLPLLQEPAAQRRRGANREAATLGMLPAGEPEQQQRGGKRRGEAGSEGEEEEAAGRGLSKAKKKRRGAGLADLPLAEQEALALRLLGGKR